MDERILRKVKSCLKLARRASNPHEAAAAMRQAENLMRKHRITDDDVEISRVSAQHNQLNNTRIVSYQSNLFGFIAMAFGVRAILERSTGNVTIKFVGIAPQPELASYCYEVLWARLKKARTQYVKSQPKQCKRATKVARGDRFAEGWLYGVQSAVIEFALTEKETGAINAYVNRHHQKLSKCKPMTRGKKANTKDSTGDGYLDGKNQSIYRPMNGKKQVKLTN